MDPSWVTGIGVLKLDPGEDDEKVLWEILPALSGNHMAITWHLVFAS